MELRRNLTNQLHLILESFSANLKIIFANKFLFFILGAVAFYLLITVFSVLDPGSQAGEGEVYNLLLFCGLLLIFYPSTFAIQNDLDTRMIEVLFGIPNYRYKVWLLRLAVIFIVVYIILVAFSILSTLAMVPVPIFEMAYQLMYPICFMGSLGFMLSTLIRNGSGTAAVMIILGLIVWILSGTSDMKEWNVFLNPFVMPDSLSQVMWREIIFYNRLYLLIGTILTILAGLYRLQYRERFI